MTDLVRARIRVFGRVQGVFFRQNAAHQARRLGLRGYIRNLEDGSVEAVYEGPKHAVERMLEWTKHGPPLARVTGYRLIWEEPKGDFTDFRITHW